MTRIVAGLAGGRRLVVPSGRNTRPTADRTREGLFSTIQSVRGDLAGAWFLDLYAGSGAVGIEAASRGAAHVTLVERQDAAVTAIRENLHAIPLPGLLLRAESVERYLANPPEHAFDVVFLDPPYSDSVTADLLALSTGGWLAADALVVVERATREPEVSWPVGLEPLRSRKYGDSTLCYGSRS